MKRLLLLILLAPSAAFADHVQLTIDGHILPITNATITIVAGPNGELTIKSINGGGSVIPGPITPDPITPTPTTDLSSVVKKATAAVPEYANKDEDIRSIAFGISFVAPYLKGNAKASEITSILKTMSDASMGANATQWSGWWTTMDAATTHMTVSQYKDALSVVSTALTANSAFASGEFMGAESYGLDMTKLMALMKFIMEYLPIILKLLA